jgi:hypothetical protein
MTRTGQGPDSCRRFELVLGFTQDRLPVSDVGLHVLCPTTQIGSAPDSSNVRPVQINFTGGCVAANLLDESVDVQEGGLELDQVRVVWAG